MKKETFKMKLKSGFDKKDAKRYSRIAVIGLILISFWGIRISCNASGKRDASVKFEVRNLIPFVDENIGTKVGACSFGVSLPFGSIRPCPHTQTSDRPGYDSKEDIIGFTNVNVGMTNKYINLLISPQTGLDCWDQNNTPTGHASAKADEICRPDYYSVDLKRFGIKTEITASNFSAIYRFTYPETKAGGSSIVIYPSHAFWDKDTYSTVKYDVAKNMITGYFEVRDGWYYSKGRIYYAIRFSKPLASYGMFDNRNKKLFEGTDTISGDGVGCFLKFNTNKDERVYLKVAVSTKSVENARKFLDEEIKGWDFDRAKSSATKVWNKALSSIIIDDKTISKAEKTFFYTSLYHAFICPKNRTGDCPWNYNGPYYDDEFCVWDTFRSLFPLLTLTEVSHFYRSPQLRDYHKNDSSGNFLYIRTLNTYLKGFNA